MIASRVLIVGGGIGGMAATLALRRIGATVDLIDIDPQWRVYGAGITVTRPTWRAFRDLGVLDELLDVGFAGSGIAVCRPDGVQVDVVEDPVMPGEPLPGSGGIMRPELHRILSARVLASGANVQLGLSIDALKQLPAGVEATFTDGTRDTYDLVVGADGVFSKVRSLIFPGASRPEYTGQTIWRLFTERPASLRRRHFFLGGEVKIGLCPVSETHLYMFLLENTPRRDIIPDAELYLHLHALMRGYDGPLAAIRDQLGPASQIVVRPLESFLLPPPWFVGRTLLIGDAAHPTTPQLASGAGIAVEDGLVLAQELERANGSVPAALARFMARRWERCRLVVENSVEIGRREQEGRPSSEQTVLVAQSLARLAEPV